MDALSYDLPIDSPTLPVDQGIVATPRAFSEGLTLDLTDAEIQQALKIILPVTRKWRAIFASKLRHQNFTVEQAMKLVDQMEDELVTRLAEKLNLIATVDATPVFDGMPPIIDLQGALPGHYSEYFGFDHERKEWEIKHAQVTGEDFLGSSKLE